MPGLRRPSPSSSTAQAGRWTIPPASLTPVGPRRNGSHLLADQRPQPAKTLPLKPSHPRSATRQWLRSDDTEHFGPFVVPVMPALPSVPLPSGRSSRVSIRQECGLSDCLGDIRPLRSWTDTDALTQVRRLIRTPMQRQPGPGFTGGQGVAGSNPAVPTGRCRSEGVPDHPGAPFDLREPAGALRPYQGQTK
jgi:hypothetical protein